MQSKHSQYANKAKSATANQGLWQTRQMHSKITATVETTNTINMKDTTIETTDTTNMKDTIAKTTDTTNMKDTILETTDTKDIKNTIAETTDTIDMKKAAIARTTNAANIIKMPQQNDLHEK